MLNVFVPVFFLAGLAALWLGATVQIPFGAWALGMGFIAARDLIRAFDFEVKSRDFWTWIIEGLAEGAVGAVLGAFALGATLPLPPA